jgi:uncharacterized protein YegJ (DUF2314 family)
MTTRRAHLAVFALAASMASCHRASSSQESARRVDDTPAESASAGSTAPSPRAVPAGSPVVGPREVVFAVYLAAPPAPATVEAAKAAAKARVPEVALTSKGGKDGGVARPALMVVAPPIEQLAAPTERELTYVGRGLDEAQAKAAAASKGVLAMYWGLDADPTLARLREAQKLILEIAEKNGGFVWDEVTRELFTPEVWKKNRVDGWDGDLPRMRRHITIHYYATEDGRHRAITLGMGKFGLPDLVASDVPQSESGTMGTILDTTAQAFVEGALVGPGGALDLDLSAVRHTAEKEMNAKAAGQEAKMRGKIGLVTAAAEQGDPDNRLYELTFPAYAGATPNERQAKALLSILGARPDPKTGAAADDPELLAVRARVQKRLPAVGEAFAKGLPLGERIVVKAPFDTDQGSVEWIWVGVTGWDGAILRGRLENEPFSVKALHLGAKVEVKQASLADYIWVGSDGSKKEGGENSAILERRESQGK